MDDRDRSRRAEELFLDALDLDPAAREKLLAQACSDDPRLREEVESLLRHRELADSAFLEEPAFEGELPLGEEGDDDVPATQRPTSADDEPRSIGPYRLRQVIGRGGMGEVWLAEQTEPLRRTVALKIIKRGLDTDEIVARFEAERQALARMNHPNVARIFDAGATPRGRPYFAMEYVPGVPITEFCDGRRLSMEQRLDLFLEVCAGVQHAHQKAIIHRDIKPSNVLVSDRGGRLGVKVIDFGVAKATGQALTERDTYTRLGAVLGTPEYMSPEQAASTAAGVDTRTDVYSLGVLLYELLVGALPFDSSELRREGLESIRARILREDPPTPSARLRTLGDVSAESARARRTSPATLRRRLRGDLDWIVMKAMEKDRTRRYGSPAELADDLRRHLSHDPVSAGPPSARYRVGKFVRRHRLAVATVALLLVGLLVGTAGIGYGLARAVRAEQVARDAAERANQEAAAAERITSFLVELFEVPDPTAAQEDSLTAREILERGAQDIRSGLEDQPLVRARLLHTMGRAYMGLGLYPEARELTGQALEARQALLPEDDPQVVRSLHELAKATLLDGQPTEARQLMQQAVRVNTAARGADHPTTLVLREKYAYSLGSLGEYEAARAEYEKILPHMEAGADLEPHRLVVVLNNYGNVLQAAGDLEAAYEAFSRMRELVAEQEDEPNPTLAQAMLNMAAMQARRGRIDEAQRGMREALPVIDAVFGPEHPEAIGARMNLAAFHSMKGELEPAREAFEEVLELAERGFGAEHPHTASVLYNLASVHRKLGDPELAEPLLLRAIAIRREALGDHHPSLLSAIRELARTRADLGELAAAGELYAEVVAVAEEVHGPDSEIVAADLDEFADLLERAGRRDEAVAARAQSASIRSEDDR